ncbi:MAG TPA: RnfABCDGE type electron transport complex subunit G [Haloplasmataceae bacterium]
MKKYLHLTLVLFVIAFLSGFILGVVNELTKGPIARATAQKLADGIEKIFPNMNKDALENEENTIELNDKVLKKYYIIYDKDNADEVIGYIFYVDAPKPYKKIEFIVGIDINGKVKGISYLKNEETPGLGTRVTNSDFINRFLNLNDVSEVDTISGATKSSQAVKNGIEQALNYYKQNLGTQGGSH